jgi:hypothetical protein
MLKQNPGIESGFSQPVGVSFTSWGDAHTCKCESIIFVGEGAVLSGPLVAIFDAEIVGWDFFEK